MAQILRYATLKEKHFKGQSLDVGNLQRELDHNDV